MLGSGLVIGPLSLRWGQPFTCGVRCQLQADAVGTEFSCRTGSWCLGDGSVREHPTLPAALVVTSIGCREETRLAFERPAGALESWRQDLNPGLSICLLCW